jgi:type II secretory pathway pseudopilin PulG
MKTAFRNTARQAASARRSGFTLIELVIVTGIMLAVLGGVVTIINQSQKLFSDQVSRFTIDEAGRHMMDRLSEQLRAAETSSFKPLAMLNSPYVTFQRVIGYVNGTPQLSLPITLEYQLEAGEQKNGKDDNKDGRIDEGYLVSTQLGSAPIRLSGNLLGLSFNPITNGLAFTATLAVTDHGRVIQKTFYQEVYLRN